MSVPHISPLLQRTLSAVYRFYDAFYFPIDDSTPPVNSLLDVSIPNHKWSALRVEKDLTYRFSAPTLTQIAPTGTNLEVGVVDPGGEYVNFEPILLTLPLPLSTPPVNTDFLIAKPLWPTIAMRPPAGETAVRGHIRSATSQPVGGLKVEMWLGPSLTPPPGTPYTVSNTKGDFLFRFPLLKGQSGANASFRVRLNAGAIVISPALLSIVLGATQIISLQRT